MDQSAKSTFGQFAKLNYYLLQSIISYLGIKDRLKIQLLSSDLAPYGDIKRLQITRNDQVKVSNNGMEVYLKLDLPQMPRKVIGIYVKVATKDQGWASANHSSSWVCLQLLRDGNLQQQLKHNGIVTEEILIKENYKVPDFVTVKQLFTILDEQSSFIEKINSQQEFIGLGLIMKCIYPGWECHIQNATIIILYD